MCTRARPSETFEFSEPQPKDALCPAPGFFIVCPLPSHVSGNSHLLGCYQSGLLGRAGGYHCKGLVVTPHTRAVSQNVSWFSAFQDANPWTSLEPELASRFERCGIPPLHCEGQIFCMLHCLQMRTKKGRQDCRNLDSRFVWWRFEGSLLFVECRRT